MYANNYSNILSNQTDFMYLMLNIGSIEVKCL